MSLFCTALVLLGSAGCVVAPSCCAELLRPPCLAQIIIAVNASSSPRCTFSASSPARRFAFSTAYLPCLVEAAHYMLKMAEKAARDVSKRRIATILH